MLFLYVSKQTIRISKIRISQKLKGTIMRNLRYRIFLYEGEYIAKFHICISAA